MSESHSDTEQAALAMLGLLFPDIETRIRENKRPCAQGMLCEAMAITDLIRVASFHENHDAIPDDAIPEASGLLKRMLQAALLVEAGDFTPRELSHGNG